MRQGINTQMIIIKKIGPLNAGHFGVFNPLPPHTGKVPREVVGAKDAAASDSMPSLGKVVRRLLLHLGTFPNINRGCTSRDLLPHFLK